MKWIPRHTLLALGVLLSSSALLFVMALSATIAHAGEQTIAQGDDHAVGLITGQVFSDLTGLPLGDVQIMLIDPDAPSKRITATITSNTGLFTITQTISDTWIIGFVPLPNYIYDNYLPEYYRDTYDLQEAQLVTVEVGSITPNINASLAIVGQVSGRVTAAEDGTPVANVLVSSYFLETDSIGYTVATNEHGYYTLTLGVDFRYKLHFDPRDDSPYAVEYYNNALTYANAEVITIPADRDTRLNVALARGGMISGTVTSSWLDKRLGFPYAHVLNDQGEIVAMGRRYMDIPPNFPENGPPGHYAAYNVPTGTYQVRLLAEQHRPTLYRQFVTVAADTTTPNIDARLVISPPVASIATSPSDPDMIMLTFHHDARPLLSTNAGQHWQLLAPDRWLADESAYEYPDVPYYYGIVGGIVPRGAPGEGTRLLIFARDTIYEPKPLGGGIYRSGDNGQSWAESTVDTDLDAQECAEEIYHQPVTTPADPAAIYMMYECRYYNFHRLLISQNHGVTWRDVTTIDARTLVLYNNARVFASPHVAGEIYVFDGSNKWYRSRNNGIDWQEVNFPLESVIFDAVNPNYMSGWTTRQDAPWTRIGKRSKDGGATWEDWVQQPCQNSVNDEPPQLVAHPTAPNVVFMRCDNYETPGLYRSDSNGDYWKYLTRETGQMLAVDYGVPGTRVLWARDDGLWASSDLGETWQVVLANYGTTTHPLYLPTLRVEP